MPRRVPDDAAGRDEAIRVLRAGGVVAIPTDTVYGIAVALETPAGVERLFAAKSRPPDRAIALLLADEAQAAEIGTISPDAAVLAGAFWPGGLTIVVRRRPDRPLPAALMSGSQATDERMGAPTDTAPTDTAPTDAAPTDAAPTVGVRVPAHDAPRALARALGPLPTTSANRSGAPEARDADEIEAQLGDAIDLILDGGPARGGPASTVVDATGAAPRILRPGAVSAEDIERCLGSAGASGVGR